MKLEHIGIWTKDLEGMRHFYMTYFGMKSNEKYTNEKKGFSSYFLSFDSGARIELMHRDAIALKSAHRDQLTGIAHVAISLGSKDSVNALTETLREKGYQVIGEPRTTGDGYYESVIEDPEGNWIELTA